MHWGFNLYGVLKNVTKCDRNNYLVLEGLENND
jgi:hypothetical protein